MSYQGCALPEHDCQSAPGTVMHANVLNLTFPSHPCGWVIITPCSHQPGMRFCRLRSSAEGLVGPPGSTKVVAMPLVGKSRAQSWQQSLAPALAPSGSCWPGPLRLPGLSGVISCCARDWVTAALSKETWGGTTDPGIRFFLLSLVPIS